MSDPQGAEFPWSSSSGTAPAMNPFATAAAAGSSRGRAAGGITLADLQKALNPKSAQEEARARQEHERQRSMDDMQNRIMGGAQHVLVYEDKAVQAQALAKIPVEDIEQKALDSPGDLAPRDAIARHLLGSLTFSLISPPSSLPLLSFPSLLLFLAVLALGAPSCNDTDSILPYNCRRLATNKCATSSLVACHPLASCDI